MEIEKRIIELGLYLPEPVRVPDGVRIGFAWARVHGPRAVLSGHGPQLADGSLAGSLGKVGAEVSPEEGYTAARRPPFRCSAPSSAPWGTSTAWRRGCPCQASSTPRPGSTGPPTC